MNIKRWRKALALTVRDVFIGLSVLGLITIGIALTERFGVGSVVKAVLIAGVVIYLFWSNYEDAGEKK